jgi:RNA polymerase sigma-70 factor (ECF subfamily)
MKNPESKLQKESFKLFYMKYSRNFWFFIYRMCGDSSMADDMFQESFFRFFRAVPDGLSEGEKKSYLYKIAVRLIIDQKRRIQVERKYDTEGESRPVDNGQFLLSMDMDKIFKLLKIKERTLLWLAYVDGYTHKEISRITGSGEKSVRVQLFRVRKKFAEILRENGFSGEAVS